MARILIPALERDVDMMLSSLMKDCILFLGGAEGYSASTLDNYDRTFRQFLAFLRAQGTKDEIESFTDGACFGFMEDLGRRGVGPNTIINKLAALSSLAIYGMRARNRRSKPILISNPTKTFKWPRTQEIDIPIILPAEMRAYLEVPLSGAKLMIRDLFIDTGLRVSEIAEANVGDVLGLQDEWFIETTVKSHGRAKRRRFPLSSDVAAGLQAYLASRGKLAPEAPLLVRKDGQRFSRTHIGQIIAQIGEAAGITRLRVSPHKFRHMVNVWGRIGGVDDYSRSRLLGHSSTASLKHYEHLIPNELHAARAKQREGMARYLNDETR